ncbi:MAG: hypothetical protein KTR18_00325 [Acidiferrobacterales bacterium]|nr:hypothetical protein [Acidiferrobacterales bacterium]
MSEDSLNDLWYRVRNVKLTLRSHVEIHRHTYRDQTWYVVQDRTTGRYFRFTPETHQFVGRLNGIQTLDEVWNHTLAKNESSEVSKGDLIRLLSQLYKADLLYGDVMPNTDELVRRAKRLRVQQAVQRWRSPIAIRFPLLDPEQFLSASWPYMRFLFSWFGLVVWLSAMFLGAVLVATHWDALTSDVIGRVFSAQNALLLFLIFPVVKVLHEFGHAYALKALGGEVHEMGVILLVFMPIPYVDASSASASQSKYKRAVIGAAGMIVELFLAVIALFVWVNSEPGLINAIAYNVILVAGVSTIFFNANPLVKFDGYYIFSDLIEIPNLGGRAVQYMGYLYQRYVIRLKGLIAPINEPGERKWLFGYAISSFAYRLFIIATIVWFLVDQFFIFGILLTLWAAMMMIVLPLWKTIMFLFSSPKLHGYRIRAVFVSIALLVSVGALLSIPIPFSSVSEGVVWVERQAWVRNASPGFVNEVAIADQGEVKEGDVLISLSNVELEAKKKRLSLYLDELSAQYDATRYVDRVQAKIIQQQMDNTRSQLLDVEEQEAELTVRSNKAGRYINMRTTEIVGTYLPRGSLLGFIADDNAAVVRVVVGQSDIDLVRSSTSKIELRFAENISEVVEGEIVREIPLASQTLPSLALASQGGGDILLNPLSDPSGDPNAIDAFFQFDIRVPDGVPLDTFGGRVKVRFSFGYAPLALQLYRPIRQTFLSKFG